MTGYQVCVAIGALLLVGMAMLHILLILGFPLGELVLGGQYRVIPGNLRYRNGIFTLVFVAVSSLYLIRAGILTYNIPVSFLNAAITVFLLFLVGATVFNFAITKSVKEKWIMGPLTILIGLSGFTAVFWWKSQLLGNSCKQRRQGLNTFISKASWKKGVLYTVFFIAMYVLINNTAVGVAGLLQITDGANILDFEFGFTTDQALDMLTALGEQGRSFYLTRIIPIDFIFPLSYMLCYAGWIALLVKHIVPKGHLKLLLLVPILAMLFDWGENIGVIFMLVKYPLLPKWVVNTASTAGILKMICIIASIAAIVTLLIVLFIKRKKKT